MKSFSWKISWNWFHEKNYIFVPSVFISFSTKLQANLNPNFSPGRKDDICFCFKTMSFKRVYNSQISQYLVKLQNFQTKIFNSNKKNLYNYKPKYLSKKNSIKHAAEKNKGWGNIDHGYLKKKISYLHFIFFVCVNLLLWHFFKIIWHSVQCNWYCTQDAIFSIS